MRCISFELLIDYQQDGMHKSLHIAVSALLLTAYVFSFSVLPAFHSHPTPDQEGLRQVHIQAAGDASQKSHSPNCIFCLRIHSSAFTLARTSPVSVTLTPRECLSVDGTSSLLPEQFEHCHGRAPPAWFS